MTELIIIGTGALALLFGSKFAAAGINVNILGTWKKGLEELENKGIQVLSHDRIERFPIRVFKDPAQITQCKSALVLVKSWQTERAAKQLQQILDQDGVALTLQNGIGNKDILSRYLGEERTAQGVTTYGASLLGPGLVRPGGDGLISIQKHDRLLEICHLFENANLAVQQVPDLSGLVWGKLVINTAINPLSALLGVKNGQLLDNQYTRELMGLIARETYRVGEAGSIQPNFSDPVQAVESVALATRENHSSMLQDMMRRAPTEIDVLCGAVVDFGQKLSIDAPYNKLLWKLIKARVDLVGDGVNENSQHI
jgi:2-dehydropantoate 2-reductase